MGEAPDSAADSNGEAGLPRLQVAISGASGLVGSALAAALTGGGHRVLRLVRRVAEDADEAHWDPPRGIVDAGRLEGFDAVVHLAGENLAAGRWTKRRKARLWASRVDATAALVASLGDLETPPRALLSASGVGIYGERGDDLLTEDEPVGSGFLAELAAAWEAAAEGGREYLVRAATGRVVAMRFGVVLSKEGGALAKMLPPFRLGLGGPIGSGRQLMSWIALDDLVRAILHILADESLDAPVNVAAPEPVAQRDFAHTLGKVLGRPAVIPAPAAAMRLALGEMADEMLLTSVGAVPARLLESGFRFRHPRLEDALRHLLD